MQIGRHRDKVDNAVTEVFVYAAEALHLASIGNWQQAYHRVQTVSDAWPRHLGSMVKMWCDVYADHATGGGAPVEKALSRAVELAFDALPPRMRWAGNLVLAGTQRGAAGFSRVWDTRPGDPSELGEYVTTVLEVVAATLALSPRGFAIVEEGLPEPA